MKADKKTLCFVLFIIIGLLSPNLTAASFLWPGGDPLDTKTWRTYFNSVTLPVGSPADGDQIAVFDVGNSRIVGVWNVAAADLGTIDGSTLAHSQLQASPGFTSGNVYTFHYWDQSSDTIYTNCSIDIIPVGGWWQGTIFPPSTDFSAFNLTFNVAGDPGELFFNAPNYTQAEGDAGTVDVTITVSRTVGSDGLVTVDYATSDNTATAGVDYLETSGTLSWSDGDGTDKIFVVTVNGDQISETDETLQLMLSNPTGNAVIRSSNPAGLTIINDDGAAALSLEITPVSISENSGDAIGIVTRNTDTLNALTVDLLSSDITEAIVPGSMTIPAGSGSAGFTITAVDDAILDGDQLVTISASETSHITGAATVLVTDNDLVPEVSLSVDNFKNYPCKGDPI